MASSVQGASAPQADRDREMPTKSPVGALWRSALIPGWGQWYTEHRWKSVLIAGTEIFFAGATLYEDAQISRSATSWEVDHHRSRRTTFFLWLIGTCVYSLIDAYVDAHLYEFDRDLEDVTYGYLKGIGEGGPAMGFLCIRF